ncbi:MAG: hypothetical protein K8T91_21430 [Planctomycetes bacterium]|nr:hypothetical protein [Planctomycetota bacterium]
MRKSEPKKDRVDWSQTPIVQHFILPMPKCPNCKASKYTFVHTDDQGDGTVLRQVSCKECSTYFRILAKRIPLTGIIDPDND